MDATVVRDANVDAGLDATADAGQGNDARPDDAQPSDTDASDGGGADQGTLDAETDDGGDVDGAVPQWEPLNGFPQVSCYFGVAMYDPANDRIVCVSDGVSAVELLTDLTAPLVTVGSVPFTGASYTPDSYATAVLDSGSQRVIVYGGELAPPEPWVVDLATGAIASFTTSNPTVRCEHTAVYAAASNRMIVYGGLITPATTDEVWVLSGANGLVAPSVWTNVTPTAGPAPAPRRDHTAVYDAASDRMIVFGGGNAGVGLMPNDVWILENASASTSTPTWTQLAVAPGPAPRARSSHSAVYDAATNRMIVFGGYVGPGNNSDETWVLTNANGLGGAAQWLSVNAGVARPAARNGHWAAYRPASNQLFVYGRRFGGDDTLWRLDHANGL